MLLTQLTVSANLEKLTNTAKLVNTLIQNSILYKQNKITSEFRLITSLIPQQPACLDFQLIRGSLNFKKCRKRKSLLLILSMVLARSSMVLTVFPLSPDAFLLLWSSLLGFDNSESETSAGMFLAVFVDFLMSFLC